MNKIRATNRHVRGKHRTYVQIWHHQPSCGMPSIGCSRRLRGVVFCGMPESDARGCFMVSTYVLDTSVGTLCTFARYVFFAAVCSSTREIDVRVMSCTAALGTHVRTEGRTKRKRLLCSGRSVYVYSRTYGEKYILGSHISSIRCGMPSKYVRTYVCTRTYVRTYVLV